MAYSLVSQESSYNSGGVTTGTVTLSVTSGNLLVLCLVHRSDAAVTSVTDSQSQTWTRVRAEQSNAFSIRCGMWYCVSTYTGSLTVTDTAAANEHIMLNLSQWSGQHATPVASSAGGNNASGTSHPHGAGVNATTGQLMITVSGQTAEVTDETVATGFTKLSDTTSGNHWQWWQYRIATGTETGATATYTCTTSCATANIIGLFDVAAGGGTAVPVFVHQLKQQGIA